MNNGAFELTLIIIKVIGIISTVFIFLGGFITKRKKENYQSEINQYVSTGKRIEVDIFYYSIKQILKGKKIGKPFLSTTYIKYFVDILFFITLSNLLVDNAADRKVLFVFSIIYVVGYLIIEVLLNKLMELKRILRYMRNRTTLSLSLLGDNLSIKWFDKDKIKIDQTISLDKIEFVREFKAGYTISIDVESDQIKNIRFELCKFSLGSKENILEFNNQLKTHLKEQFTPQDKSEKEISNARSNISLVCGFLVLVLLNNIISVYIVSFIGVFNGLKGIFSNSGRLKGGIGFGICLYFIIYNLIFTV